MDTEMYDDYQMLLESGEVNINDFKLHLNMD